MAIHFSSGEQFQLLQFFQESHFRDRERDLRHRHPG